MLQQVGLRAGVRRLATRPLRASALADRLPSFPPSRRPRARRFRDRLLALQLGERRLGHSPKGPRPLLLLHELLHALRTPPLRRIWRFRQARCRPARRFDALTARWCVHTLLLLGVLGGIGCALLEDDACTMDLHRVRVALLPELDHAIDVPPRALVEPTSARRRHSGAAGATAATRSSLARHLSFLRSSLTRYPAHLCTKHGNSVREPT